MEIKVIKDDLHDFEDTLSDWIENNQDIDIKSITQTQGPDGHGQVGIVMTIFYERVVKL